MKVTDTLPKINWESTDSKCHLYYHGASLKHTAASSFASGDWKYFTLWPLAPAGRHWARRTWLQRRAAAHCQTCPAASWGVSPAPPSAGPGPGSFLGTTARRNESGSEFGEKEGGSVWCTRSGDGDGGKERSVEMAWGGSKEKISYESTVEWEIMMVNGRDKALGWEIGVCRDGERWIQDEMSWVENN